MGSANSMNMDESGVQTYNATTGNLTGSTITQYAILAGDANNKIQNISGTGSSGQVLTSNGAGALPTWQAGGGAQSQVLIQSQNASSSSFIEFKTGLTGYNRYKLVFYNLTTTGVGFIYVTYSTDGGSTYLNSGYEFGGACCNRNVTVFPNGSLGTSAFTLTNNITNIANFGVFGEYNLNTLQSTTLYKNCQGFLWDGDAEWAMFGYNSSTTNAVNGIKIAPNAGTFDAGTFLLYGITD